MILLFKKVSRTNQPIVSGAVDMKYVSVDMKSLKHLDLGEKMQDARMIPAYVSSLRTEFNTSKVSA